MVEAYARTRKARLNEYMYMAWHTAALSRAEKIPALSTLMQKEDKKNQTNDEMLAMAKILNAAFGGKVVEA